MNKFGIIRQGPLLDDLNYVKQLEYTKKRFGKVRRECCINTKQNENDALIRNKFDTHPTRIYSESDDSSLSSSSVTSGCSNVDLELNNFEENKLKIKNAREKLHKKLIHSTKKNKSDFYLGLGDSHSEAPSNTQREENAKSEGHATRNRSIFTIYNRHPTTPSKTSSRAAISESAFEKKFKILVEKSLHTISDIRSLIEKGIDQPDGDEDVSRRCLRVKEFSNRFSRNYLYPIARQLDELSKLKYIHISPNQKLLSAYQVVLNGLQAYHNHLPTSIGGCSSDKLKLLLNHLLELCDIHSKMIIESDENGYLHFIKTFKMNAELTLQKIENHFSAVSTESVLKSTTTKLSLPRYRDQKNRNKSNPKTNLEVRLSMYSTTSSFKKGALWRKAAESLAKKKLCVKSKYKTAAFRHRPPVEKSQILALPSKCKLFAKKSSTIFKRTPIDTPVNEDNITTMVELEQNRNGQEEKENDDRNVQINHEEIVVKLLQLVLDNKRNNEKSDIMSDDAVKLAAVLNKLSKDGDVEVVRKILEGLQKKNDCQGELQLKVVGSQESAEEVVNVKKRKEPRITVTGAKNAKLICIKDDNSVIEIDDSTDMDNKDCQTEKRVLLKPVSSSQTQTDLAKNEKNNKSTQRPATSINMKRIAKSSKCLQMLQKDYAVNIIRYKLDFHQHCKINPMYRRTTNILPWLLMGKLSDAILDRVLLGVAQEIEVNSIVDRIYQSELQL